MLVERDGESQYLTFDFIVENAGCDSVTLAAIRLEVRDAAGRGAVRRFVDRRWDLTHSILRQIGTTRDAGRYAYDLAHVDTVGRLFPTDGVTNADWYAREKQVRAPPAGTVVAAANDQPDYEVGRTCMDERLALPDPLLLSGNYVVIDHGGGEYSLVAHLRRGSVTTTPGARVEAGANGRAGGILGFGLHRAPASRAAPRRRNERRRAAVRVP